MSHVLFFLTILLFSAPAHADFRNQMGTFGQGNVPGATDQLKSDKYCAIAKQMGYEWVMGDPWTPNKSKTCAEAGLKVMFNSNADRLMKLLNFNQDASPPSTPEEPTAVNLGTGNISPIPASVYTELLTVACLNAHGESWATNDLLQGTLWKYKVSDLNGNNVLFTPNYYSAAGVQAYVDRNVDNFNRQEAAAGMAGQLYRGLFMDEVTMLEQGPPPQEQAPSCHNTGNPAAATSTNPLTRWEAWIAGRLSYIAAMKVAFRDAIGTTVYGGTSGNPFNLLSYVPEHTYTGSPHPDVALDLYYSESSGGTNNCDTLTALQNGASTGCGTQNTQTWSTLPINKVMVQMGFAATQFSGNNPVNFYEMYEAAQLIAGRIAHQGGWFGWYGVPYITEHTPATLLFRAIPNWDNMINATSRSWTEFTNTYSSSNSFFNNTIVYSRHWRDRNKIFVVRNSGSPTITLPAGLTLSDVKCTDAFFLETTQNCSNFFTQSGTTVTPGGSVQNGVGYILIVTSGPALESAEVNVADRLDVCWTPNGASPMLPANTSTGWTVKVNTVTQAAPQTSNRQGSLCYFLVYPNGTISAGQTVTVAYNSGPGNITNSDTVDALTFADTTATNNLSGTAPVLTQTRSHFRHLEGDELLTASMKYGGENGNMNAMVGARLRVRLKVENTAAVALPTKLFLYFDHNDNTWAPVPTSCASSDACFTDSPLAGAPTTRQLTQDQSTFVSCTVMDDEDAAPAIPFLLNSETECEYAIGVAQTTAPETVLRFRVHTTTGAALTSYAVTPRVNVLVGHNERHGLNFTGGNW